MSIITTIEDLRVLAKRRVPRMFYVIRALALGAKGEAGVARCLEIIRNELDLTMAFCGLRDVRDVDPNILLPDTW